MKKNNSQIIPKPTAIFIPFIIFALFIGCASNQVANQHEKKNVFDRIDEDMERIRVEKIQWKYEYESLQADLEEWTIKYHQLKTNEKKFIESMPDKQLKLYSDYLDSLSSGNPAKVEFNRRQLIASLNDAQKSYLVSIYNEFGKLEQEHKEYNEKHNELLARKNKIEADIVRNIKRFNYVMAAISEYMGSSSYTRSYRHSYPAALSRLQDTVDKNRQRDALFFESLTINSNLRDIASAIRGF